MVLGNPNTNSKPGLGYGGAPGRKSHQTNTEAILGGLAYQSPLPTLNTLGYNQQMPQSENSGPQGESGGLSPGGGGGIPGTYKNVINEIEKQIGLYNQYGPQILKQYESSMAASAKDHGVSMLQYQRLLDDLMNVRMPVSEGVFMAGY